MEILVASLKIDKELLLLTPPLSNSDSRLLKIKLSEGMETAPVFVWNTTILDGYEKYEVCEKLGIRFEIQEVPVRNKQEAIVWICKKNLQREDLSSEIRRFLIGKRYVTELRISKAIRLKTPNRPNTKKSIRDGADRVRDSLGEEYSLSPDQLIRYRMYAKSMDKLAAVVPEIYTKIMDKSITLSVKPTVKYAGLSVAEMQELSPQILENPYVLTRLVRGMPIIEKKAVGRPRLKQNCIDTATTAVVLKHDSDAEVMSLASTVQTWTKAMKRVMKSADIASVTISAIGILTKELSELSMMISTINKIIEEHTNVRN